MRAGASGYGRYEIENKVTEGWSVQEGQGTSEHQGCWIQPQGTIFYAYLKLNTIHKCMWTHTHTLKKAKPLGLCSHQEPQTNQKQY